MQRWHDVYSNQGKLLFAPRQVGSSQRNNTFEETENEEYRRYGTSTECSASR
jgi:hypothetical protein